MAMEIERKFLVHGEPWQELQIQGSVYTQGYLSTDKSRVIRVRLCEPQNPHDSHPDAPTAYITIKSSLSALAAAEYEYPIPVQDARILLDTLAEKPLIEKIRYAIAHEGHIWHVDSFMGLNAGLVIAEVELNSEEESFAIPPWLGKEVSLDMRYKNVHLHLHPFSTW